MTALTGLNFLRLLWVAASDRERGGLLVTAMFGALTMLSFVASSGLDAVNKIPWVLAFSVIAWSQLGSITNRAVQEAITAAYVEKVQRELTGAAEVTFDYTGDLYDFAPGRGWVKRRRA